MNITSTETSSNNLCAVCGKPTDYTYVKCIDYQGTEVYVHTNYHPECLDVIQDRTDNHPTYHSCIVCPHCGYADKNSHKFKFQDKFQYYCPVCSNTFNVETRRYVKYLSTKIEEDVLDLD